MIEAAVPWDFVLGLFGFGFYGMSNKKQPGKEASSGTSMGLQMVNRAY
jgi:hypothetical protein